MKCQGIFSEKNVSKYSKLKFLPKMLDVNTFIFIAMILLTGSKDPVWTVNIQLSHAFCPLR